MFTCMHVYERIVYKTRQCQGQQTVGYEVLAGENIQA